MERAIQPNMQNVMESLIEILQPVKDEKLFAKVKSDLLLALTQFARPVRSFNHLKRTAKGLDENQTRELLKEINAEHFYNHHGCEFWYLKKRENEKNDHDFWKYN